MLSPEDTTRSVRGGGNVLLILTLNEAQRIKGTIPEMRLKIIAK